MQEEPSARLEVTPGGTPGSFALVGDVDSHTAAALEARLAGAGTATDVLLDLSGVGFIDSSGLRAVLAAHQRLEAAGHRLLLQAPSDAVRRLIEITGLGDHLHLV